MSCNENIRPMYRMRVSIQKFLQNMFKMMSVMGQFPYLWRQAIEQAIVANNIDLFDTNNDFHQYNTRTNKNLHLPSIYLLKYAKHPYVNGIKVYNHLPKNIKNLVYSMEKFKNALKSFFHQHPFYSIREYFELGSSI